MEKRLKNENDKIFAAWRTVGRGAEARGRKGGEKGIFRCRRGGEERRDFSVDFTWTDAESRKNVATDKRKSRDKS